MWTDATAAFAKAFPHYEARPQQDRLATTIEQALASKHHLLAQAGTGTGKSFAGLIPAIDHAMATGLPVIVATATKALQGQYVSDLETLQRVYKPFTFALLKGRSNYACLDKLNGPDVELKYSDFAEVAAELTEHPTGDFDDLVKLDARDKGALSTSSDECTGQQCPFFEQCFAQKAKDQAQVAQVVVTNHALLSIDAAIRGPKVAPGTLKMLADGRMKEIGWSGPMLPHHSAILVDEAHELPEYATSALGTELKQRQIERLLDDALNWLGREHHDLYLAAKTESTVLYSTFADLLGRESTLALSGNLITDIGDKLVALTSKLQAMVNEITGQTVYGDEGRSNAKKRLTRRFENLTAKLTATVVDEFDQTVRWIETSTWTDRSGRDHREIVLKLAPLSVAGFLRANVWAYTPSVLLSATLALGGDFNFIADQVGMVRPVTFDAGTPFDYQLQARTYIPRGIADPTNREAWQSDVVAEITELVRAADGRALLLFTSRKAMNEAHQLLSGSIGRLGHRVLKQGELPNPQLRDIFKTDEHSVLFALKSFFTGMDIQGDSLRLVVVDKLPFAVPTDVLFKARCDLLDAKASNKWKDGSFPKLSVPSMALTLIQAQGRLIRTRADRGVFALLDTRVLTKPYGKKILAALPDAPVLTDLADVTAYLRSLDDAPVTA